MNATPTAVINSMQGPRLAYVVVPIKDKVKRVVTRFTKGQGLHDELVEEDGGFLVYFPRGHALRLTAKDLRRYRLDRKPKVFVDVAGIMDPESAIGKIFMSQNEASRINSWKDLEKQVIQLATARTGPIPVARDAPILDREEIL